jgi:hypothetical protein
MGATTPATQATPIQSSHLLHEILRFSRRQEPVGILASAERVEYDTQAADHRAYST